VGGGGERRERCGGAHCLSSRSYREGERSTREGSSAAGGAGSSFSVQADGRAWPMMAIISQTEAGATICPRAERNCCPFPRAPDRVAAMAAAKRERERERGRESLRLGAVVFHRRRALLKFRFSRLRCPRRRSLYNPLQKQSLPFFLLSLSLFLFLSLSLSLSLFLSLFRGFIPRCAIIGHLFVMS